MIVVNFFHSKWASARGINGDIGLKTKTEYRIGCQFEGIFTLRHETKMEKTQFAEYGRTRRDLARAEAFFAPFSFNFLDISRACTCHTLQTGRKLQL